ncbi:hypothetical protein MDAP_000899 [Mitosporidium daphniae]
MIFNILGEGYPLNRFLAETLCISIPSLSVAKPSMASIRWVLVITLFECISSELRDKLNNIYSDCSFLMTASQLWYYFYFILCNFSMITEYELMVPFIAAMIYFQEYLADKSFTPYTVTLVFLFVNCNLLFGILLSHFRQNLNLTFLDIFFNLCLIDLLKAIICHNSILQEIEALRNTLKNENLPIWMMKSFFFYYVVVYLQKTSIIWKENRFDDQSSTFIGINRNILCNIIQAFFPATSPKVISAQELEHTRYFVFLKTFNALLLFFGRSLSVKRNAGLLKGETPDTQFSAFNIKSVSTFFPLIPPALYEPVSSNSSNLVNRTRFIALPSISAASVDVEAKPALLDGEIPSSVSSGWLCVSCDKATILLSSLLSLMVVGLL